MAIPCFGSFLNLPRSWQPRYEVFHPQASSNVPLFPWRLNADWDYTRREFHMTILQAMDGKFYDVPDEDVVSFEVPRERLKALLEKAGLPVPQGGPGPGQAPGHGPGPGQGHGPAPTAPVVVQIFAAQPSPGGLGQPGPGGSSPPPDQGQGGDGDVNPYWWWRNITYYRPWYNGWGNW
jgi:hypothetical protein